MLAEIVSQRAAAGGMPQFAERFRFDLPDALARHAEVLPHFLQRVVLTVFEAEAHLQHFALALGQRLQGVAHLLFEELMRGGI